MMTNMQFPTITQAYPGTAAQQQTPEPKNPRVTIELGPLLARASSCTVDFRDLARPSASSAISSRKSSPKSDKEIVGDMLCENGVCRKIAPLLECKDGVCKRIVNPALARSSSDSVPQLDAKPPMSAEQKKEMRDSLCLPLPDSRRQSIISATTCTGETTKGSSATTHALAKTWAMWQKTGMTEEDLLSCDLDAAYKRTCQAISKFDTIERFMELFNGIPNPSRIIDLHHFVRTTPLGSACGSPGNSSATTHESDEEKDCPSLSPVHHRNSRRRASLLGAPPTDTIEDLEALMFFEDGVFPSWEDPAHKKGGQFEFLFKTDFPGAAMDEIWERFIFMLIGNALPYSEYWTGIRISDRLPKEIVDPNVMRGRRHVSAVRLEIWHREIPRDKISEVCKALHKALFDEKLACGGKARAPRFNRRHDAGAKKAIMMYERYGHDQFGSPRTSVASTEPEGSVHEDSKKSMRTSRSSRDLNNSTPQNKKKLHAKRSSSGEMESTPNSKAYSRRRAAKQDRESPQAQKKTIHRSWTPPAVDGATTTPKKKTVHRTSTRSLASRNSREFSA